MHLTSDSATFHKWVKAGQSALGWRVHCDLSNFSHVTLLQMNIEPYFAQFKTRKICKVYCNLMPSSQTDPMGTIAVFGGLQYRVLEPSE